MEPSSSPLHNCSNYNNTIYVPNRILKRSMKFQTVEDMQQIMQYKISQQCEISEKFEGFKAKARGKREEDKRSTMLQRAASNAYSWWVASHIRTKQSKWLEQSLQDMEEKSAAVVKLISEDGDSFAQRANMYYRTRPELLNFVEESFRAYRALAERFDHISKELQNANSTLASAFPDQFQFAMDDDDEFGGSKPPPRRGMGHRHSEEKEKTNIPSVPKQFPTKNIKAIIAIASKANNARSPPKKPGKRSGNKAVEALRSGFNKTQAIDEIDKLQKKILTKQTEKEFTKSSYENGVAKYWQIEKEITEMQEKVSNLQDVFGVGKAIEDSEARTLMLEAALKSCQQSLAELQEKQAKATAEAEEEGLRIRSTRDKILAFKGKAPGTGDDRSSQSEAEASTREEDWVRSDIDEANATKEIEVLRDKMKAHFDGDSSVSVSAMVEKIDELVNKVITLETAVSSQTAMVSRMKEASGELENLVGNGKSISNSKLKEMDLKLKGLRELESSVQKGNSNLKTEFTEASGSLALISEKLPDLNLDEVIEEDSESTQESTTTPPISKDSAKVEKSRDVPAAKQAQASKPEKVKQAEDEPNWQQLFNDELEKEKALQKEYTSVLENYEQIKKKLGEVEDKSEGSLTELRELRDANAKKDEEIQSLREKLSENDSSSVLQNYEEVMKKLGEVEGKSKGSLTELRELKDAIAKKDEEIRSLHDKLTQNNSTSVLENNELKKKLDEAEDMSEGSLTELKELRDANAKKDEEIQSLRNTVLVQNDYTSVLEDYEQVKKKLGEVEHKSEDSFAELRILRDANCKKDEEIRSMRDKMVILQKKLEEYKNMKKTEEDNESHLQAPDGDDVMLKLMQIEEPREMSPVEASLRADIDEILEENLDFWMRFSSSFAEIQKYYSQVEDLKHELSRIEECKTKKDWGNETGSSFKSNARAIYKHLKEIQTDLTVWMERSLTLKDELQCRFSQLCRIQEQITQALNDGAIHDEMQFTSYQAAKFQGEVLNMQQENNKVADELQASLDNVTIMQIEVEKITSKLTEDLGIIPASKIHSTSIVPGDSGNKNQVPLRSFIFGVKPKKQKQSIFSVPPVLHKKYQQLKS